MAIEIGQTVGYILTKQDAEKINRRRTDGPSIAERIKTQTWPLGAQAHIGNTVNEGDVFPAVVVKKWSETSVNLQVFLDGNDTYWVTSIEWSNVPGTWHFTYTPVT